MIRQDIIDRIISDVSILEVAENGGVSFTKKSRSRHWACCPFHNESGPSFYVDTATNTWRCFGCHSGGNVISLYRKLENDLPFPIACRNLAKKYLNEDIEDDWKPSNEELEKQKEQDAMRICREKIARHKLDMKLVESQYTFDRAKLLFYFTSEGRVDFRELVKDLAGVFRTRIELRQIGIRDEAKMLGGLGTCGRPLCC